MLRPQPWESLERHRIFHAARRRDRFARHVGAVWRFFAIIALIVATLAIGRAISHMPAKIGAAMIEARHERPVW